MLHYLRSLLAWLQEQIVFHELRRLYVVRCTACDRAAASADSIYEAELNACKQGFELRWPYTKRSAGQHWYCLDCTEQLTGRDICDRRKN